MTLLAPPPRVTIATEDETELTAQVEWQRSPWPLTGAMLLAFAIVLGSFYGLLQGADWWFVVVGVTAIAFLAAAIARTLSSRILVPTLAAVIAAYVAIMLFFCADTSILGVIPTLDTVDRIDDLVQAGTQSIANQNIPARPVVGILFIFTAGAAAIAVLMDLLAFVVRLPAATGLPLLFLLVTPSIVEAELADPFFFMLAAAAYLFILFIAAERRQATSALAMGAITITASLLLSVLLPPVDPQSSEGVRSLGYSTGINPIISLGDDLRRSSPITAMTYTTTSKTPQYFSLTVLDDFTGKSWDPTVSSDGNPNVGVIGNVPGRTDDVEVVKSESEVTLGNIQGRWLPVPYAPRSIDGLAGDWLWMDDTLSVRTMTSNTRAQKYTVQSEAIVPTTNQLEAAGERVPDGLDKYLALPEDLPPVVAARAENVVGDADTNFDKAIALQSYFRGSEFTYSEDAPVEQGYDGSSADIIATFLDVKSGYCVHFSSAMATMARALGIPARIAVGFTTGEATRDPGTQVTTFTVTTDNLHAWPELYFDDLGWVRFEPTKGVGSAPEFPTVPVDDPNTPDIDESKPSATPTPTSTGPASVAPRDDGGQAAPTSQFGQANVGTVLTGVLVLALLAALIAPWAIRFTRRRSRFAILRTGGSALVAWQELLDTAHDLGLPVPESETPREATASLAILIDESARDALERLRRALEIEVFAIDGSVAAPTGPELVADVRTVLRALRRTSSAALRLRAVLLPASVLTRNGVPRFAWLAPLYRQD